MGGTLLYIADPMCSWCWGFSPVMDAVRETFGDTLKLNLIMGGLRPGTTEAMDDAMKEAIKKHWRHVHEATGQPFDFAFFDREGFVYDTEPPSRAVVTTRHLDPRSTHKMLKRVHRAFYAENRDVTEGEVLADLAEESGFDRTGFADLFGSEAMRLQTQGDFDAARRAGISGFPALLAGNEKDGYKVLTIGYRPWEKLESLIKSWQAGGT